MTRVWGAVLAAWEFIVGEDWRTALGVVVALALTALLSSSGISAWWMVPLAVIGLLTLSLRRAERSAQGRK